MGETDSLYRASCGGRAGRTQQFAESPFHARRSSRGLVVRHTRTALYALGEPRPRSSLDPLQQLIRCRTQSELLHEPAFQEECQVGGHLGIRQRTVMAAGHRKACVGGQRPEFVVGSFGKEPACDQH